MCFDVVIVVGVIVVGGRNMVCGGGFVVDNYVVMVVSRMMKVVRVWVMCMCLLYWVCGDIGFLFGDVGLMVLFGLVFGM